MRVSDEGNDSDLISVKSSFDSPLQFDRLLANQTVFECRKSDGLRMWRLNSLHQALAALAKEGTFLLVEGTLSSQVAELAGALANRAKGIEHQTTRSIALDRTLTTSSCRILNNGCSVKLVGAEGNVIMEFDGLVIDGMRLWVNEAKARPKREHAEKLATKVGLLRVILASDDLHIFSTKPAVVWGELSKVTEVKGVLSGFYFEQAVKDECFKQGVNSRRPSGAEYATVAV